MTFLYNITGLTHDSQFYPFKKKENFYCVGIFMMFSKIYNFFAISRRFGSYSPWKFPCNILLSISLLPIILIKHREIGYYKLRRRKRIRRRMRMRACGLYYSHNMHLWSSQSFVCIGVTCRITLVTPVSEE